MILLGEFYSYNQRNLLFQSQGNGYTRNWRTRRGIYRRKSEFEALRLLKLLFLEWITSEDLISMFMTNFCSEFLYTRRYMSELMTEESEKWLEDLNELADDLEEKVSNSMISILHLLMMLDGWTVDLKDKPHRLAWLSCRHVGCANNSTQKVNLSGNGPRYQVYKKMRS